MKEMLNKLVLLIALLIIVPLGAFAQEEEPSDEFGEFDVTNAMDQQSSLGAMLGYTSIGGESYMGMRIQPEFALGKLGFGLDIPLLFSLDGKGMRTQEFESGVGWMRLFRYVRWGVKKRDPFYIRVGDLTGESIGYGMLLDNYTNSIGFEKRKVGVSWDILIKNMVGIEGLYSDFDNAGSHNLLAIRPYVRPFGRTRIPIVRTTDIGFTYVTDKDQTYVESTVKAFDGVTDSTIQNKSNYFLDDGVSAWAVDIGVMPISTSFMQLKVYAQYGSLSKNKSEVFESARMFEANSGIASADSARLVDYGRGNGFGIGVDLKFKAAGALRIDARLERLWYQNYFLPQFFDASYEMSKDLRYLELVSTDAKKGIYGALSITALDKVRIGGTLMIPDEFSVEAPAMLTLNLDASRLMEKFIITGQYVKGGLTDLSDAFVMDDRSLLTVRFAYKLNKFLVAGVDYRWTWSVMENGEYRADNYVTPYVGLQFPFGQNKDNAIDVDNE